MGQQSAKEGRRSRTRISTSSGLSPGMSGGTPISRQTGVRPSAVNDSVLQQPSFTTPGDRHVDPHRMDDPMHPTSAPAAGIPPVAATFPVVLRYKDHDVWSLIEGNKSIFVEVEAMNWQPLPMTPSTDSFYTLLELPAGNHNYRFRVNGMEVVDSTQPLAPKALSPGIHIAPPPLSSTAIASGIAVTTPLPKPLPARDGKPANTIFLNDVLLTTKEDDDIMDSGTGWGQEAIMFEESRKYPPIVPLHLRYTPLNTPPTLVRCSRDGRMAVMDSGAEHSSRMPPEHLPLPLSVTINHVYFQRREDHAVMGITTRYCNKFTTVVYYTHLPSHPVDVIEAVKA